MLNKVLAVLALVLLAAFIAVLVVNVPDTDLIVVSIVTVGMAAYDFVVSIFRRGGRSA